MNDSTCRNCGVEYVMEIYKVSDYILEWSQVDHGSVAYCLCPFNLSVTIDSLKPGHYTVRTYFTDALHIDSDYVGSVTFDITKPVSYQSPSITHQYQSICLDEGIPRKDRSAGTYLSVYPDPADDLITITTELTGDKTIRFITPDGKCMFEYLTNKTKNSINISRLPKMVYIISVANKEKSIYKKFCKN